MGNKCDMDDKRVIPVERGEEVRQMHLIMNLSIILSMILCLSY